MTEKKEIKGRFKPGQSGNPAGKPKGTKDWRSEIGQQLRDSAPQLIAKCIKDAIGGDPRMMDVALSKIMPNLKGEFLGKGILTPYKLDDLKSLNASSESLANALSENEISTTAAKTAHDILEGAARIASTVQLEERVKKLEDLLNKTE